MATIGTIRYRNGSDWVDILHPVGSFYFSTQSTSPASLFGGTWSQISGAVVRGATSTGYGGSDTHTLTISEMPAHKHQLEYGSYVITGGKSWQIPYAADGGVIDTDNRACYNTGGGAAFTELPRYYNCYIWYRSA